MSINGMKQQQGEKRVDFIKRCQDAQREHAASRAAMLPAKKRRKSAKSSKPVYGSQEWAETRGDDLGESPDY